MQSVYSTAKPTGQADLWFIRIQPKAAANLSLLKYKQNVVLRSFSRQNWSISVRYCHVLTQYKFPCDILRWVNNFTHPPSSCTFFNSFVKWGTIQNLRLLLWRLRTPLNCDMSSSPDTLQVFLVRLASVSRGTASKSTFLNLSDLPWSSRFLQPKWNFLNHLVTVQW